MKVIKILFGILIIAASTFAYADFQNGVLPHHNDYDYAPSMVREANYDRFWWCGNDTPGSGFKDVIYYQYVDRNTMVYSAVYKVLRPSSSGWDSLNTCDPSVVLGPFRNPDNGQSYNYAMYYTGVNSGGPNQVGVAFSNDGITWVKYSHNPVIAPQAWPAQGTCRQYGAGEPATYWNGSSLVLIHYDGTISPICEAAWIRTTTDGVHFSSPIEVSKSGVDVGGSADFAYDATSGMVYGAVPSVLDGGRGFGFYSMPESQFRVGQGTWQLLGEVSTDLTGYQENHNPGFLRNNRGSVTSWLPALEAYYGRGTSTPSTWDIGWTILYPTPANIPFKRYFSSSTHTHWVTTGSVPATYNLESTQGYLSFAPQSGARPLYSCQAGGSVVPGGAQFISLDVNCEGQTPGILGLTGYIYYPQPSGFSTVALYRCSLLYGNINDHFVSSDPGCEGHNNDGLLGYARTQP